MTLFQVPRTGLYVALRMRDAHCPPCGHVESEVTLIMKGRTGFAVTAGAGVEQWQP